jgi:hypothetical protein
VLQFHNKTVIKQEVVLIIIKVAHFSLDANLIIITQLLIVKQYLHYVYQKETDVLMLKIVYLINLKIFVKILLVIVVLIFIIK